MSKRNYSDIIGNCKSIGADQTLVNAIVTLIKPPKTPSSSKSPYMVRAMYIGDKSVLVTFQTKTKRTKTDTVEAPVEEEEVKDNDGNVILGGTIKPGESFFVNCFDANIAKCKPGNLVGLSLTANLYTDNNSGQKRITYKAAKIITDSSSDCLDVKNYTKYIINTELSAVPTRFNINPEDYAEDLELKKMVRYFILPLANTVDLTVEPMIVPEADRFICKNAKEETSVGFNLYEDGKTTNHLWVLYKRGDGQKDIAMRFAFNYDFWKCIGILDQNIFKKVAYSFLTGLKDAFVYGGSDLEHILGLSKNISSDRPETEDDDPNPILYTTGFISQFGCDMAATIKNIGVQLSLDYVNENYGPDSDYSYTTEHHVHPLNNGLRLKLLSDKTQVIHVTELNDNHLPKFWKDIKDMKNIQFWGIPAFEDMEKVTSKTEDPKVKPAAVFLIVN